MTCKPKFTKLTASLLKQLNRSRPKPSAISYGEIRKATSATGNIYKPQSKNGSPDRQENLIYFAGRFDNVEFIDASGSLYELKSLLSVQNRQLVFLAGDPPEWAKQSLSKYHGILIHPHPTRMTIWKSGAATAIGLQLPLFVMQMNTSPLIAAQAVYAAKALY